MISTEITDIELLVEEPSMEAALYEVLPKIIRKDLNFQIKRFQCKDELLKQLPLRLNAYAKWLPASSCIVVLVDRDDEDCRILKTKLNGFVDAAALSNRKNPKRNKVQVINRIAIEELESWFFGDWEAVVKAYPRMDKKLVGKDGFRKPDEIKGGTWEALERELKKKNYFTTGLRKIECARTIASHMSPARNRSPSFIAFRDALAAL
jgi:Domain of unknown function (DUF4276)